MKRMPARTSTLCIKPSRKCSSSHGQKISRIFFERCLNSLQHHRNLSKRDGRTIFSRTGYCDGCSDDYSDRLLRPLELDIPNCFRLKRLFPTVFLSEHLNIAIQAETFRPKRFCFLSVLFIARLR